MCKAGNSGCKDDGITNIALPADEFKNDPRNPAAKGTAKPH